MKTVFFIIISIILSSVVYAQSTGKNMEEHSSNGITNYAKSKEFDLLNLKNNANQLNFIFETEGIRQNTFQSFISGSRKNRFYFTKPDNQIYKDIPIAPGVSDYEIMNLKYDLVRCKRKNIKISFGISFGADFPEYSINNKNEIL